MSSLLWFHWQALHDLQSLVLQGSKVLDIGCGEGAFAQEIPEGYQVYGLDILRECLNQAKAQGFTKSWILADASRLPFKDQSFDVVTSHHVIEHVKDHEKMVLEIVRVLVYGGFLIITTPTRGTLGRLLMLHRNAQGNPVLSPDHIREYESLKEFVRLMTRCSDNQLKVVKKTSRSVRATLYRLCRWFLVCKRIKFPALFYYNDNYVIMRKCPINYDL